MDLNITAENLLAQLGYPRSEVMMEQMNAIIDHTKGFDKFSKHLLSLSDDLQHYGGYVAMSNSFARLKIKTDNTRSEDVIAFTNAIKHWSEKYKVILRKVEGRNTYYIIGQK